MDFLPVFAASTFVGSFFRVIAILRFWPVRSLLASSFPPAHWERPKRALDAALSGRRLLLPWTLADVHDEGLIPQGNDSMIPVTVRITVTDYGDRRITVTVH